MTCDVLLGFICRTPLKITPWKLWLVMFSVVKFIASSQKGQMSFAVSLLPYVCVLFFFFSVGVGCSRYHKLCREFAGRYTLGPTRMPLPKIDCGPKS